MRSAFRVLAAALLLAALIGSNAPVAAYEVAGMRDAMRSVFKSMRTLLELSTDSAQLAAPGNQRSIFDAATELENQANLISGHVPRDEISFLASSLDRYAQWIRRSFEWRLYNDTRQLVHAAVDVCIACHTRLTSSRDSPLAEDFLNDAEIAQLPARQRVKLQTATRRFDDALDTYSTLLQQSTASEDFEQAESVVKVAGADSLVNYVVASRLLYDYLEEPRQREREPNLEQTQGSVDDGAKAYYLLGLAQYRIDPGSWLPQSELYLEKAIRTAPASEHARRAFDLLAEKMQHNYPAVKGGMPADVRKHLQILQDLVGAGG